MPIDAKQPYDEANIFAEDLASVRIDAITWTSQPGQAVRKIPTE